MAHGKRRIVKKTHKGRFHKRLEKGRVCKKYGCKHRLSVYNSEVYCNVHHGELLK
ncbi:MAG: hypothetical protein WC450_12940 [Candidatus Omnitrophota bacterium]